jgi:DNA-binding NtrC family response regulator
VRELENVVKSAAILADGHIQAEHLPAYIRRGGLNAQKKAEGIFSQGLIIEEEIEKGLREGVLDLKALVKKCSDTIEERVIRDIMERSNMNMAEVAQFLKIDPKTLRAKIRQIRPYRNSDSSDGNCFPERGGNSLPPLG